jgi:hypothetical protein
MTDRGGASTNTPLVELARDRVDRHRSLGAFGKPVYQSHVQLRALLQQRRRPGLAEYFARPHFDADSGEIRWTTSLPGVVRRRPELDDAARAAAQARLEEIHAELGALASELRGQGGGAASFASVIEQAMKVPRDGDFVHLVGAQPVLAFWGFEDAQGRSVDPALHDPGPTAPQPPGGHAPAALADTAPRPVSVDPGPVAPAGTPPRRRRWWWLWLLLLLLFALALAWALSRCTPPGPVAVGADGVPKTEGRDAVDPLAIPEGALERGDLSFLEGVWQLGERSLQAYEGRPDNVVGTDRVVLRFGRDGSGSAHSVERVRRGAAVPECTGKLSARTDGKKLYFERGACTTPGRPDLTINGSRHECVREASGRTICYGINHDGVRWEAPLRRLR